VKLVELRGPADSAGPTQLASESRKSMRIDIQTWFICPDHRAQRNIQDAADFFGARIGTTPTTAAKSTDRLDVVCLLRQSLA